MAQRPFNTDYLAVYKKTKAKKLAFLIPNDEFKVWPNTRDRGKGTNDYLTNHDLPFLAPTPISFEHFIKPQALRLFFHSIRLKRRGNTVHVTRQTRALRRWSARRHASRPFGTTQKRTKEEKIAPKKVINKPLLTMVSQMLRCRKRSTLQDATASEKRLICADPASGHNMLIASTGISERVKYIVLTVRTTQYKAMDDFGKRNPMQERRDLEKICEEVTARRVRVTAENRRERKMVVHSKLNYNTLVRFKEQDRRRKTHLFQMNAKVSSMILHLEKVQEPIPSTVEASD